jgi:hypothetical protein
VVAKRGDKDGREKERERREEERGGREGERTLQTTHLFLLQLADGSGGTFTSFNLHPLDVYIHNIMIIILLVTESMIYTCTIYLYLGDEFRSLQVKLRDGVLQLLDLSITLRNNQVPEIKQADITNFTLQRLITINDLYHTVCRHYSNDLYRTNPIYLPTCIRTCSLLDFPAVTVASSFVCSPIEHWPGTTPE